MTQPNKVKVYIAGPMSGLTGENRPAFFKAADLLNHPSFNNIVLNPAILPDGLSQSEYMAICMPMVMMADTVLMLEGWEHSEGATAEFTLAKKLGKQVRFTVPPVCPLCRHMMKVAAA